MRRCPRRDTGGTAKGFNAAGVSSSRARHTAGAGARTTEPKAESDPAREVENLPYSLRMRSSGAVTALRLLSSTVLAQVAVLAATVAAATWLTPRDFAFYGAAWGLAGIVNSVNTLGVETRLAVVEAATMEGLLRTGLAACSALTAVGALGAVALAASGKQDWAVVLAFAMTASVVYAAQQLVTTLALREHRHEVLVRSRVAQGVVNAGLIVGLSASPMPGYVALTSAWVASMIVGLIVSLNGWTPPLPDKWRVTKADVRLTRTELGLQPVTNLLAGITVQIPLVVLPSVASASFAGSWALCTRVLGAGVMAAFSSLQPVYYATAAAHVRENAFPLLATWHRKWAIWLTAVTLPGVAVAGLIISYVLPLVGDQWLEARILVVPACVYWGSQFFGLPLSQTILLVGRVQLQLVWTVVRFMAAATAFALWPVWGALASVWTWSVVCALTYLTLTVIQGRVLRQMAEDTVEPIKSIA